MQIIDSGLLPGKLIQQLNGQTQRLLGQQSLAGWPCTCVSSSKRSCAGVTHSAASLSAAYTNLRVNIDSIRSNNEKRTEAQRKNGLIIWSGREHLCMLLRPRQSMQCGASFACPEAMCVMQPTRLEQCVHNGNRKHIPGESHELCIRN